MRAPFQPSEILLLGPGPSPVSHRVRAAMAAPVLGHLDPEFVALMDRVQQDLRTVYGTENPFTLPISGTGSAGMETVLVNLLEPGDRIVIGIHGIFGERMHEIATRAGAEVVAVRAEPGCALDPAAIETAIRGGDTRFVAFVHAETSTGVLQPPEPILEAARRAGALTLVDCVTSLGGSPVELDRLGVDAAYSGTQKCLGVPPGLSPVSFSQAALERVRRRRAKPSSWYLDVSLLGGYWGDQRVYHHTAPISMVYALAAGLDDVLEEGLQERYQRHRQVAASLYRGLEALGLECLVEAPVRTPMLTSIRVPDGLDEALARKQIRLRHRIEIGGGLGALKGRIWRVGLMGHGARIESVTRVLMALADVLEGAGRKVSVSEALASAAEQTAV